MRFLCWPHHLVWVCFNRAGSLGFLFATFSGIHRDSYQIIQFFPNNSLHQQKLITKPSCEQYCRWGRWGKSPSSSLRLCSKATAIMLPEFRHSCLQVCSQTSSVLSTASECSQLQQIQTWWNKVRSMQSSRHLNFSRQGRNSITLCIRFQPLPKGFVSREQPCHKTWNWNFPSVVGGLYPTQTGRCKWVYGAEGPRAVR